MNDAFTVCLTEVTLMKVELQSFFQVFSTTAVVTWVDELHSSQKGGLEKSDWCNFIYLTSWTFCVYLLNSVRLCVYNRSCSHLIWLLFVVDEVTIQVVLALVLLHQLLHFLVLRVLLEVGVGTWDSPLQVLQLEIKRLNYIRRLCREVYNSII